MPPISLWQVATGLGVGAFFGVVFFAIVKVFGTDKGKGLETSKLGEKGTVIIAALIVLFAGAAMILALVLYAPQRNGPTTSTAPQTNAAALTAAEDLGKYRGLIFNATVEWMHRYANEYQKLKATGVAEDRIPRMLKTEMHKGIPIDCHALSAQLDSAIPLPDGALWEPLFLEAYKPFGQYFDALVKGHSNGTLDQERDAILALRQPCLDRLQSLYEYARARANHPEQRPGPKLPAWSTNLASGSG